jgi:hypothetical protein
MSNRETVGLPGNAACNVGFTAGCGTIEHLSTAEFQSRIESEMRKWERDYDKNLVDQLFNGSVARGSCTWRGRHQPS